MNSEQRSALTGGLWVVSAIVLGALFISAAAQGELTPGHMLLAFVILGLAVAGTFVVLYRIDKESEQTKAKRQRIDSLLDNLSDEEIFELKQRLADADSPDAPVVDYVGDDGELVLSANRSK